MKPVSINFHLWKPCNYSCKFCYEKMPDIHGSISQKDSFKLLSLLREAGCEKINFAGGEPTLCPYLGELLAEARSLGFVTSIVTNGARLKTLLEQHSQDIDWIAISVDSSNENVNKKLGRGNGNHVRNAIQLFESIHQKNIKVKLNTVVNRFNYLEDMSSFVKTVKPHRWKIFQVLRIEGQNDGDVEPLLISKEQFLGFVGRHQNLSNYGINVVPENNEIIKGSYIMIDPLGRFFSDAKGNHEYSQPILDVGVNVALSQVQWNSEKFILRGGLYDWNAASAVTLLKR